MKLCPECNETFADELKFCELDGTKLRRDNDPAAPQGHNRAWSLLGVGVLLGAMVIAAMSIVFTPKARITPTVASNQTASAATTPSQPAEAQIAAAGQQPTAAEAQPEITVGETPLAETKKKDKTQETANTNSSVLNPKAAAQDEEESQKTARTETPRPLDVTEPPAAPAPIVKPVSNPRETESASKPAPTTVDPKKDKKDTKDSDKNSDEKKDNKGKDKKKGGFFGVFKKIFGKN
jgi:hypothetical protein